ncbi:zinc ABC transporter substrate-binding protein [Litoreibacter arenae]|uniref:High-affinity zinc uptake system protein ZnuA n=1 Tax=Litoreibacter arenae DSM 19593 TaxID=1123360 RepID=S9QN07_9RHOB|nr:zinc ABC transporter substrate-binding protein [Litoreibacter arenae]EPX80998.1 Zinc ABC transporter, periplasmic-binding protein ZnuA [Litoreibacter arenae DSM 19593]
MLRTVLLSSILFASPAFADVPRVVTDIAPVHSLVAQVMGELGEPEVLVTASASPHSFALRPSQAGALEQAQAVFWVGESLTPWLEPTLDRLSADAVQVELLHLPETQTLEFRDADGFEAHDHDDDHGHDAHGDIDPHAWLNPDNAMVWLDAVATELSTLDPENAATYDANAQAAKEALAETVAQIETTLAPAKDTAFIVFHDAYHYFEARFGIEAIAAISLGDAATPGPARVERIQETVRQNGVSCAFSEPQFSDGLLATVLDGTDARVAVLDPLGAALPLGPQHYEATLRAMADAIAGC